MKKIFLILCLFSTTIGNTQSVFEFDKIRLVTFDPNEIFVSKDDINEQDIKGQIIFNEDTTSVDIILKGIKETLVISKSHSTYGNQRHLRTDFYDINNIEQLVLFYHNNRLYTVAINNRLESFCNLKYIKTKW